MPGIMGIMALCLCSHCTELLTGGKTLAKTQQSRHRPSAQATTSIPSQPPPPGNCVSTNESSALVGDA